MDSRSPLALSALSDWRLPMMQFAQHACRAAVLLSYKLVPCALCFMHVT